jgi:hypothetical protein
MAADRQRESGTPNWPRIHEPNTRFNIACSGLVAGKEVLQLEGPESLQGLPI